MMTRGKRIVSKLMIAIMVASCGAFYMHIDSQAAAVTKTSEGAIFITYRATPKIGSLKIKWKKKSKVKKWVIYRADITSIVESDFRKNAKLSMYKKIKKLSGNKTSFVDKKVKRHHYYEYIIKGYKKSKGKYKLAYSSYLGSVPGEILSFDCPGLARPEALDAGDGEFWSNSPKRTYLYVELMTGMTPKGVVVYRKAPWDKAYKKIKMKKVEKKKKGFCKVYRDDNVKSGVTYRYIVKAYYKKGKKKYYSKASRSVGITADYPRIPDDE